MEIRKEELNLFPTLVSLYDLSYLDLKNVVRVIDNFPKETFHLLGNGGTDYRLNLNILNDSSLVELKKSIQDSVADYSKRLGVSKLEVYSSWSSITDVGGRLELHRHDGNVVSGVFYPAVNGMLSPLLFKNPIDQYKMFEIYDSNTKSNNISSYIPIYPRNGMLVLFPSWLEHKTDSEVGIRKIISFNASYDWFVEYNHKENKKRSINNK
tara:strand:- start:1068 stop:1697 length:630 start_codon:yes stop_codon:yes gene_type:complete